MTFNFRKKICIILSKTRIVYYFITMSTMILCFFLINTRYSLIYINEDKPKPADVNELRSKITETDINVTNDFDTRKYILLWTSSKNYPFTYFGKGNGVFIKKGCKWKNCYVTDDRNYLGRYTEFDVIAFNGPQISHMIYINDIPTKRNIRQKYVYANIESARNYPIHTDRFEGFFNWTWTYKLNSDAVWGYFVVRDNNNNIIGPNMNMHWMDVDNMDPISEKLKKRLESKQKTAVWFSSNCFTAGRREEFVHSLQYYLKEYNMDVDIYGECGPGKCPKKIMKRCLNMAQRDYYFYLAFENAYSEDYVTEKVVYALKYDVVPVVYGGANYSRFLPEGIYLDALKLGPKLLAKTMYETIINSERYHNFFRWKSHYSFHFKHESPDTDDYCKFCAIVNNDTLLRSYSVHENFSDWWMDRRLPPVFD